MIPISVFNEQGEVVTTIGFLKEAPKINLNGFCVYHKNRLIMVSFEMLNMLAHIHLKKELSYTGIIF